MSEEYNPSVTELAVELIRQTQESLSRENLGNLTDRYYTAFQGFKENWKPITKEFLEIVGFYTLFPYAIPTAMRIWSETPEAPEEEYGSKLTYAISLTVVLIDFAQIAWLMQNMVNRNLEILAIPVGTNLASAIYEKVRSAKRKLIFDEHIDSVIDRLEN